MNKKKTILLILLVVFSFVGSRVQAISVSQLEKIKKYKMSNILATHTTYFDKSEKNRTQNIKIATKKINEIVVKPGQTFSFNEVVGPRTKENNFKEAIEIVNNEYVIGVGGGVCQVSSTLYNSVLFSGLKIIDRQNHSKPVSYIPLGRGATVYYDAIDFKFKNDFSNSIMILSKVIDNRLTITLLGTDPGINVEVVTSAPRILDPEVIKKTDNSLNEGTEKVVQSGKVGYEVTTRRIIKSGSKILENNLISEDVYPPVNKIIKVNSKKNN